MNTTDELVAEIARLKRRMDALEEAAFAKADEYVVGLSNVARVVGLNVRTCQRRLAAGDFPPPCKVASMAPSAVGERVKQTWRRADLIAYAEGR